MATTRGNANTSIAHSRKSDGKQTVSLPAAKRSAAKHDSTTASTLRKKQNPKAISKKTPLSTTCRDTTKPQARPANWRDLEASTTVRRGLESDPGKDPVERIVRRGPHGSPVRDHLGYELDYYKVVKAGRGSGRKQRYGPKYEKMIEDSCIEEEKTREIMGTPKEAVSAMTLSAWQDRVSRDLEVPYHTVEMKHYEEWKQKGFRGDPGEFEAKSISEADDIRIWNLSLGSAFRVGSTRKP